MATKGIAGGREEAFLHFIVAIDGDFMALAQSQKMADSGEIALRIKQDVIECFFRRTFIHGNVRVQLDPLATHFDLKRDSRQGYAGAFAGKAKSLRTGRDYSVNTDPEEVLQPLHE
ncbi:MAG: hypothetical protein GY807_00275 [Gammaproteobacteria bacterium]|nr:hypothetical protein [Gammaproteobacteria bacterium]